MYKLICPFCQHNMQSPVMRVDSLATCRRCRRKFRVKSSHIKELVVVSTDSLTAVHSASMEVAAGTKQPSAVDSAKASRHPGRKSSSQGESERGASGVPGRSRHRGRVASHSGGADRKQGPVVVVRPYADQPRVEPRSRDGGTQALQHARRRQVSTLVGLTLATCFASLVVVLSVHYGSSVGPMIGVYYNSQHDADTQADGDGGGQTVSAVGLGTMDQAGLAESVDKPTRDGAQLAPEDEPSSVFSNEISAGQAAALQAVLAATVPAERVSVGSWREVDEPFLAPLHMGPIRLVEEQFKRFESGQAHYSAKAVKAGLKPISSASVELMLVDFHDRVIGQLKVALTAISENHPRQLDVPIPPSLASRASYVAWTVDLVEAKQRGVLLENIIIQVIHDGVDTTATLMTTNLTGRYLQGAVFLIGALDGSGRPYAQWRIRWPKPIAPSQELAFKAKIDLKPHWEVMQWDLLGVGELATEADPSSGWMSPKSSSKSDL